MNVRVSALRPLGENLNMENIDSDHYIDFGAVGVYIAGLQVMTAMLVASLTCVLASWVLPASFVSAMELSKDSSEPACWPPPG